MLPVHAAVDESYMLPVLARFNGRPEVDGRGNIVYSFPELQQTAQVRGAGAAVSTARQAGHLG